MEKKNEGIEKSRNKSIKEKEAKYEASDAFLNTIVNPVLLEAQKDIQSENYKCEIKKRLLMDDTVKEQYISSITLITDLMPRSTSRGTSIISKKASISFSLSDDGKIKITATKVDKQLQLNSISSDTSIDLTAKETNISLIMKEFLKIVYD
jgi:hypothetical protein